MLTQLLPATDHVLASFSDLKTKTPLMAGSFVADSSRVVMKLLESDLQVESVLAPAEWYQEHETFLSAYPAVAYYHAPKAILEKIVGFNLHEGVMARAKVPADVELKDFYHSPLIVLDGITKAENVGAIVRNAAAFGVKSMLLGPDSCHPFNRRCARVAMGNLFTMRVHQTQNLSASLRELRSHGVQVYAFENRPFAKDLAEIHFPKASALIIGSEGAGVAQETLAAAEHFVRIPIDEHVFALNAACASAVGLYAYSLQHKA